MIAVCRPGRVVITRQEGPITFPGCSARTRARTSLIGWTFLAMLAIVVGVATIEHHTTGSGVYLACMLICPGVIALLVVYTFTPPGGRAPSYPPRRATATTSSRNSLG